MIQRPAVHAALLKVDNNILKLDTVQPDYIRRIDRPTGHYDVKQVIERMKEFKGRLIVQTMFMKGTYEGESVDNTSDAYVKPWIEALKTIAPRQVMIYTIDRETPAHELQKATHEELDRIAGEVRQAGFDVSVSY
jgi:wyosine [tRNA(Phe)-imidazoG37] synthetase (radical SAM superfamily)